MCELILSFFKSKVDDDEGAADDAACGGRSIQMFSDMIQSSLRDEDFISGKFFYILLHYVALFIHICMSCSAYYDHVFLFVCRRLCIGFGFNF